MNVNLLRSAEHLRLSRFLRCVFFRARVFHFFMTSVRFWWCSLVKLGRVPSVHKRFTADTCFTRLQNLRQYYKPRLMRMANRCSKARQARRRCPSSRNGSSGLVPTYMLIPRALHQCGMIELCPDTRAAIEINTPRGAEMMVEMVLLQPTVMRFIFCHNWTTAMLLNP